MMKNVKLAISGYAPVAAITDSCRESSSAQGSPEQRTLLADADARTSLRWRAKCARLRRVTLSDPTVGKEFEHTIAVHTNSGADPAS